MAKLIRCDRCKEEQTSPARDVRVDNFHCYDLCKTCCDDLYQWLQGKR